MLKHSYHARLSVWHVVVLVIILAISLPVVAKPTASPTSMLQQTSDEMLTAIKTYQPMIKEDPRYLFIIVNEVLTPHVDMEAVARLALGKHWATASVVQRQRFTQEFTALLVRFYSLSLAEYLNLHEIPQDVIEFLPGRDRLSVGNSLIHTRVHPPRGKPVDVNYCLHQVDGEWKVFDVTVDGISIVSAYRSVFNSELRKHGIDNLIATLSNQNRRLLKA
jgi:phospholipid transport system substrate-binding protein